MSILIKGLEMPKPDSCITIRIYPDGMVAHPAPWSTQYFAIKGVKAERCVEPDEGTSN